MSSTLSVFATSLFRLGSVKELTAEGLRVLINQTWKKDERLEDVRTKASIIFSQRSSSPIFHIKTLVIREGEDAIHREIRNQ